MKPKSNGTRKAYIRIYGNIPKTEEEFNFWDEMNFGIKSVLERFDDWKKWKQTSEGKRATKKRNRIWLKQLQ